MTTAFQPDLFQSDAFQIAGGVAATDFQVTISFTQDSDGYSLQFRLPGEEGAGSSRRKRYRYIAKYRDQEYEFTDLESLEEFVHQMQEAQRSKPKKARQPIKIQLTPDFKEEAAEAVSIPNRLPAMPTTAAMAQIRKIDNSFERFMERMRKQAEDDDEDETMMILL